MKSLLITLSLALSPLLALALPYDEQADAPAELSRTLQAAKQQGKPVLVLFGANWCGDCVALDKALQENRNAELVQREFLAIKVDVGRFNRNTDLAKRYGNPIKKGIPAAVLLSPKGELVYATQTGELSNARRMSDDGIHDFFKDLAAKAKPVR